jgi:formylglycine-generating enzyme required for sulfatase activity
MKRKVIRGGSWKDIAYYLQTGSRSYEYQDSAKSYIGYRCVMTYLGRGGPDQAEEAK